uniref:Cytoplasmic polyadenylation element-binding protein 4-like n=1 Tax=Phallusia mammillata TaxID=59560 RepID=A0A6F9D9B5_9ASCI|nr:cytoplasmic polyadenylation element-binding protein 4-like [Phallusia mammillata]
MATISNDFGATTTTNASAFSPYEIQGANNLFPSNSVEQQQLAIKAQLMFLQHQQRIAQSNGNDQMLLTSTTSPTPVRFSPSDSISPTFDQTTPEKPILSQSPPSPADSGVVADSKSDGGNVSQDLIHSLEHSKIDDGLGFGASQRSAVTSLSFEAITTNADQTAKSNDLGMSSLGLTSAVGGDSVFAASSSEDSDAVTFSQNLAAIWSTPSPAVHNTELQMPGSSMDDMMLQALHQQRQQQLTSWPSQVNQMAGMTNPPPGLYNNAVLQKQIQQNTAAQIQAIQQQLAIRRSQSMVPQPTSLNRSTSHQPGMMGGYSNVNQSKMNGFLPGTKLPASYSSWSNGQAQLGNGWPIQSNRNAASLLNSLQQTSSSNRIINASSEMRKQSVGSQAPHAPRLARSISTPAHYLNGMDENPFFKMNDTPQQNGLMSLNENGVNDLMSMTGIESQLCDILRSNESQNMMPRSTAGLLPRRRGKWMDMNNDILYEDVNPIAPNLNSHLSPLLGEFARDRYSRKVFVGGLPPDIDEEEIKTSFKRFGPLVVDWPHKAESKSYFPPKGYAFLLFQEELSVQNLIGCCMKDGDKLYLRVSSPTIRDKPVQIRPWNLSDSDFVLDGSQPLDPRKTIFVGGVPRPLRAIELAMIMDRLYGGVCYAGIDVDPELKYPKGAGRVAFSNQQSYIAAISARFVQLQHGDIDKRVEVKPYVLDDQHCDECQGARCGGKFAPFFCANVTCLQYYCENCWATIHSRPGKEFHKPLVKEGADRASRSMTFRW